MKKNIFAGLRRKFRYSIYAVAFGILLILCIINDYYMYCSTKEGVIDKAYNYTNQIANNIDMMAEFVEQTADIYTATYMLGDAMDENKYDFTINSKLLNLMKYSVYAEDAYLFSINGNVYSSDRQQLEYIEKYYNEKNSSAGKSWGVSHGKDDEASLLYSKLILNSAGNTAGELICLINTKQFKNAFNEKERSFFGDFSAYIEAPGGAVELYGDSKNTAKSFSDINEGYTLTDHNIVIKTKLDIMSMNLITVIPFAYTMSRMKTLLLIQLALFLVFAGMIVVAERFFTGSLFYRLENLYSKMSEYSGNVKENEDA